MRYLSIDTETTGLNPETCQILSIAAVLEDTEKIDIPVEDLPHFHYIFRHDFIQGEPYALNMNKDLIEIIKDGFHPSLTFKAHFALQFRNFCTDNNIDPKKIKVAGKNFSSFDKNFIDKILNYKEHGIKFHHRVLDVGSVFVDFKNDEWLPDLTECMKRAGVKGAVTHDALEDARDVVRTLRAKYA